MKRIFNWREHLDNIGDLVLWTFLVVPIGILAGSASALFLWSLEQVEIVRWQNGWVLFLLPLGGIVIHVLYKYSGKSAEI
jgi:hypothetical protein